MLKRVLGIVEGRRDVVSTSSENRLPSGHLPALSPRLVLKKVLPATLLLVLTGAAQADLSLTGGTPVTFSGYSAADILGTGPVSSGLVGSTIFADSTGLFDVTFLGKETRDLTSFTVGNGTTMTINSTDPVLTRIDSNVQPGVLHFTFRDATDGESATNGVAVPLGLADFAVFGTFVNSVFKPDTANGAYTYVLGFNDGATSSADYDDLVIGIKLASPVPEPETCALMLAGLGALAFTTRRRRKDVLDTPRLAVACS